MKILCNILVFPASHGNVCQQCNKVCDDADDIRPYGPNGTDICFDCAMKDEPATEEQFRRMLMSRDATFGGYTMQQRQQARRINEVLKKVEGNLGKLRTSRLKLRARGLRPNNPKVAAITKLISKFAQKRNELKKQQAALRRKGGFGRKNQPTSNPNVRRQAEQEQGLPSDVNDLNDLLRSQPKDQKQKPKPDPKAKTKPEKEEEPESEFEKEKAPVKPKLPKNVDNTDLDVMGPEDIDTAINIETDPKQKATLQKYKKANSWRWAA